MRMDYPVRKLYFQENEWISDFFMAVMLECIWQLILGMILVNLVVALRLTMFQVVKKHN